MVKVVFPVQVLLLLHVFLDHPRLPPTPPPPPSPILRITIMGKGQKNQRNQATPTPDHRASKKADLNTSQDMGQSTLNFPVTTRRYSHSSHESNATPMAKAKLPATTNYSEAVQHSLQAAHQNSRSAQRDFTTPHQSPASSPSTHHLPIISPSQPILPQYYTMFPSTQSTASPGYMGQFSPLQDSNQSSDKEATGDTTTHNSTIPTNATNSQPMATPQVLPSQLPPLPPSTLQATTASTSSS